MAKGLKFWITEVEGFYYVAKTKVLICSWSVPLFLQKVGFLMRQLISTIISLNFILSEYTQGVNHHLIVQIMEFISK